MSTINATAWLGRLLFAASLLILCAAFGRSADTRPPVTLTVYSDYV